MYYRLIPSLDNRYEINIRGNVRNAKTKRPVTIYPVARIRVMINGKSLHRSIELLLWETFKLKPRFKPRRPTISKGAESYDFPSFTKCVAFLLTRIKQKRVWIFQQLRARQPEIYGWLITYKGD